MSEIDERAKAALDALMPGEAGRRDNETGAETVREFLGDLLKDVWANPPKYVWGRSDWRYPLEVALINAGLVEGTVNEPGYGTTLDEGLFRALVHDAINKLAELPEPPEMPPLDAQVDVLSSLVAHLRLRLEWIERGADYEAVDPNATFSPAQVWGRLLRNTALERLLWIEGVIGQAEAAGQCWMVQHDRTIEQQRDRIRELETKIIEMGGDPR